MVHERNVRNMMQELIGARLIRLSEMGFVVELPDGNTRSFKFYEDSGDCCGYNKFTANMVLHEDAPAITNISFYESSYGEGHTLIITFFGVSKPIAKLVVILLLVQAGDMALV